MSVRKFWNEHCGYSRFTFRSYVATLMFLGVWFYASYTLAQEGPDATGVQHAVDLFKVMATIMLALVGTIQGLIAFIYINGIKNIDKIMTLHIETFNKEIKDVKDQLDKLEDAAMSKEEHNLICEKKDINESTI